MGYVKDGWDKIKDELSNIDEFYTIKQTIHLLNTDYYYKNYFGRARNRTMIKRNPKLYKSIYEHTDILETTFKKYNKYKGWYNFKYRMVFLVDNGGDINTLKCECGRTYNWTKYCRFCPNPKKTWLGKTHTDVTKKIQRISTLQYLSKTNGQLTPRYNINSIPIIEAKAKELGITDLQHAENGGEFHIKDLGYWVDGYSKEKNIVIEYDERHHFRNDKIKVKDIQRQNEIETHLNCKFIRIRCNG